MTMPSDPEMILAWKKGFDTVKIASLVRAPESLVERHINRYIDWKYNTSVASNQA